MPASMGMMMLGRLIMSLVGDRDSWNQASLMSGMMGGMGGGGMGGGGMGGGMGGGGMGGMGGGMRSVPPTGLPFTDLKPDQTRHLPTRLMSLSAPNASDPNSGLAMPAKGEKLRLGNARDNGTDPRVLKALIRMAEDKAPESVATMVLWSVASGLSWDQIATKSQGFANANELALARSFVEKLDGMTKGESGTILYEIKGSSAVTATLAKELASLLKDHSVLGLQAKAGVPASPDSPAVACKIVIDDNATKPEATVFVVTSNGDATAWVTAGKFTLPVELKDNKPEVVKFADALAEGLLGRLVRTQVSKAGTVKGKAFYKVRIDNASPLILNGLAILGEGKSRVETTPKVLSGISISPRKSMTVPLPGDVVESYGLRKGVHVIAADLSGL